MQGAREKGGGRAGAGRQLMSADPGANSVCPDT